MGQVFTFENWPDTDKGLRVSMARLIDDGRTYRDATDMAKQAYLRAVLFKMRDQTKEKIAGRCGLNRRQLAYLIKKTQLDIEAAPVEEATSPGRKAVQGTARHLKSDDLGARTEHEVYSTILSPMTRGCHEQPARLYWWKIKAL